MKLGSAKIQDLKKKVAEAKAKNAKGGGDFAPLTGKFNAIVEQVIAKTYNSGSFGYEVTYKLTDADVKGRKMWETLVTRKADGSAVDYSAERLARRLSAFGLSDDEMANFNFPDTDEESGDLDSLAGAIVTLKLEREIRNDTGEPTTKVKAVYPSNRKAA